MHHRLVCQLLGIRPQGATEGSAYGQVHYWGQASCHPGPLYQVVSEEGTAITASSLLRYNTTSLAHQFWGVSPSVRCRSSHALSVRMGSVAAQLFSGLSRDVRSGSSPGSGWPLKDIQILFPKQLLLCAPAVCLGSFFCWKLNLRPSLRSDQRILFLMV